MRVTRYCAELIIISVKNNLTHLLVKLTDGTYKSASLSKSHFFDSANNRYVLTAAATITGLLNKTANRIQLIWLYGRIDDGEYEILFDWQGTRTFYDDTVNFSFYIYAYA